jgi:ketosteroid isomerase-like protein
MATNVSTATQVFDHHIDALVKGDLDELVSDYTESSVVIAGEQVAKGPKAIREFFAGFLSGLMKPGTYKLELDVRHIEGDIVYVLWHAHCQPADVVFAGDTFVIRDGKIAVQTVAAKIEPHN